MTIHHNYNRLTQQERHAVDEACDAARIVLRGFGLSCANDDRAERVVEAIATYAVESMHEPGAPTRWGHREGKGIIYDPPLTEDEKRELYRRGRYAFSAPAVCTAQWDDTTWIKYIDAAGLWQPDGVLIEGRMAR
jgi:hypothetical protein